MSRDGYQPPGVEHDDDHFYPPDGDEDCACGHVMDEHEHPHGVCTVEDCDCVAYEPAGAYH